MTQGAALVGAAVFDGAQLHHGQAVWADGRRPVIVPVTELPSGCQIIPLDGGVLMPGFVDLQVNGGGGVLFNDAPTVKTLGMISAAHVRLGTRAFLPTLITDTPARTTAAIAAVTAAITAGLAAIVGLHLEGPHLSVSRKGAHEAALIRPMSAADLDELCRAATDLPNLMVTVAPESVTPEQINALRDAGAIVFLGHSEADFDTAARAYAAGARGATHLFNAMSPLTGRAPGMVGAALATPGTCAGLIADGIHVHPATIRAAIAAKPQGIFLVTDAMACAGSEITAFTLNGRKIHRRDGRLTLADGTLAGADLTMARAVQVMIEVVGDTQLQALTRATSGPASVLRNPGGAGHWPDDIADLIHLTEAYGVLDASALT